MKYATVRAGVAVWVSSMILAAPSVAEAGWGHLHGGGSSGVYAAGYGSSGAYGSSGYAAAYGSSGYAASYGSSGYAAYSSTGGSSGGGLLHRLKSHVAAKHARHAARRAAYGSSGYYASSGSTAYSYGSSGHSSSGGSSGTVYRSNASYGSSGNSGAVSYGSTGTSYGSVGSTAYGSAYNSQSAFGSTSVVSTVNRDEVFLTVSVPGEAKIYVNGNLTTSTGSVRQFVSRGLEPAKNYKFEVRAELEAADGQMMVETKEVVVSAGANENLQFSFAGYENKIETALTLHVPEGAEVTLAGNDTQATGTTRTYRTSRLAAGEVWDEYEVQVRLGDQVKSRSVRLMAGEKLQLTFAFDESADKLAAR